MILETRIPRFPLNQFIDCFIYYDGYKPGHSIDRFLPDGNTEIIIDFDDRPQHIYDNQTLKEIQACRHVWASGVRTEFIKEINLKFEAAESFLLATFHGRLTVNPAVEYALAEIIQQPDQLNLARMNESIGYSQKHFIGMFKRQVGITPKAYLKIIRFQKAITEIEERREVTWTTISQDCGFYDQAHFINDFKFFSGFTPEEYVRRKNDILNYVPVG